jgi:hypothetical protein
MRYPVELELAIQEGKTLLYSVSDYHLTPVQRLKIYCKVYNPENLDEESLINEKQRL